MIAPAGGPDTKLSERHESHLHSPIGRTRLLAVGLSGPPSRDRMGSHARNIISEDATLDARLEAFTLAEYGDRNERRDPLRFSSWRLPLRSAQKQWYESDAFVEWLSSYCMGGRIVEISREGDGEISNYSANTKK